jgi:hypothetical protein
MNISTEKYLAEMQGRIDALAQACVSLLVTHPDVRLTQLISKIGETAKVQLAEPRNTAQKKAYLEGMSEIAHFLEAGLKTAE